MARRGKSLVAVEFMMGGPRRLLILLLLLFGSGKTLVAVEFMMPSGVGTCFVGRKTPVTVEFISVVPEMWPFGMLLAELYWSFDINMGEHPTKFRETSPKLRVGQRRERSGM